MEIMVSFQYHSTLCGNQTFTNTADALRFVAENRHNWRSHSTFTFTPDGSGIYELSLIPAA